MSSDEYAQFKFIPRCNTAILVASIILDSSNRKALSKFFDELHWSFKSSIIFNTLIVHNFKSSWQKNQNNRAERIHISEKRDSPYYMHSMPETVKEADYFIDIRLHTLLNEMPLKYCLMNSSWYVGFTEENTSACQTHSIYSARSN